MGKWDVFKSCNALRIIASISVYKMYSRQMISLLNVGNMGWSITHFCFPNLKCPCFDYIGWNIVVHYTFNSTRYGWIPNKYLILKEKDEPMVEDIQTYLLGNGQVK